MGGTGAIRGNGSAHSDIHGIHTLILTHAERLAPLIWNRQKFK